MVQAKRFEQTFVNEYLAWNLHDYDVRQRGIKEGREDGIKKGREDGIKEGKFSAYAELVKDGLLSVKDAAEKLEMSEADFQSRL